MGPELKPVQSHRRPRYPARSEIGAQPALLARAIPRRWARHEKLVAVLVASAGFGARGDEPASQQMAPRPRSLGFSCIAVTSPAFETESSVVRPSKPYPALLSEENLARERRARALMREVLEPIGLKLEQDVGRVGVALDGWDRSRRVGVEMFTAVDESLIGVKTADEVSTSDALRWTGPETKLRPGPRPDVVAIFDAQADERALRQQLQQFAKWLRANGLLQ